MAHDTGKSLRNPVGDTDPVYLHEILGLSLRRVVRAHGLSRDQVCDLIDTAFPESALTPENLKHLATDRSATFVNPLGIVTVLAALGESEMLERMARAAGFLLVPVTKVDGTAAGLLAAAAAYQLDVAETEQLVAQALRDGMTEELATKILNECQEDEEKRATLVRSVHAAVPTKGRGNVRHRGH